MTDLAKYLKPNIKDFPMEFYVEYSVEKGEPETSDRPRKDDEIIIDRVYFEGKECLCPHIKAHLEYHMNINPEIAEIEMICGEVIQ